jgi:hypothetical protein
MADRRLTLVVSAALVFGACSGGPAATSTPGSGATATPATSTPPTVSPTSAPTDAATPTAAPATATPLPSPGAAEIAAWASDICAINATFLSDNQQITLDIPEPTERTLEALKQVNANRQPRIEQGYADAVDALHALTPYPGGESFRLGLLNEFQSALDAMPAFFQAIADATTVEEIDAQYTTRGTVNSAGLLGSARSVVEMDVAFSDAVAAVTTGCRFFEFDARARVHGIETPDFSEIVIDETFDEPGNWPTGDFDGGTVTIADGALTVAFDSAVVQGVETVGQPTSKFHDARIESHFAMNGSALVGLSCRGSRAERYYVLVNAIGLILIYRTSDNSLIGRRAAPDDFDASLGLDLAIECLAGNLDPFSLIVYLNEERVAEVQDAHALESEGFAGMLAQAFTPGASATFDSFRVLVPAD